MYIYDISLVSLYLYIHIYVYIYTHVSIHVSYLFVVRLCVHTHEYDSACVASLQWGIGLHFLVLASVGQRKRMIAAHKRIFQSSFPKLRTEHLRSAP